MLKQGFLYFMMIAFLPILGCQKDVDGFNPQTGGSGVITASINGSPWAAPDGYVEDQPPFGLRLRGVNGSNSEINLIISPYDGLGQYALNGITSVEYREGGDIYQSISGQITITSNTQESVEGHFQCEMVSSSAGLSLSVTQGQFLIPRY